MLEAASFFILHVSDTVKLPINLNNKLRKILQGGDLTWILLTKDCQNSMANVGKHQQTECQKGAPTK
jgi:hypothetical protein